MYVLLVFGGWVVTRRFQEVARAAEHAVDRENVALDAIVESEEKIKGLNKKIGNVENRLDNIEKKVSDELPDILTKQLLEETDKRYFHKAELSKGPAEPNMKVEVGRKLLREATADVRDAFREPVSLDTRPTVEREWLAMQVSKLATEILSPDALKDLEAFESAHGRGRNARSGTSRRHRHWTNWSATRGITKASTPRTGWGRERSRDEVSRLSGSARGGFDGRRPGRGH